MFLSQNERYKQRTSLFVPTPKSVHETYFSPHTTFTLSLTARSSGVMSRLSTVLVVLPPYPHRQLDLLLGVFLGGDAADAAVEKRGKITTRLRQNADQ